MDAAVQDVGINVLLIEDFLPSLQFLSKALKLISRCSIVYTAANAESGLELLNTNDVDVAFIDLMMAGMGGVLCIEKIREHEKCTGKRIKVVAMSAESHLKEEALSVGADVFLHKLNNPVKSILEIVKSVISEKNVEQNDLEIQRHSV